ncbi:hypothetical protein YC2023_105392 [Brassica napus]
MAVSIAIVSALGDETKVAVTACCEIEFRASMIQPKPSQPMSWFLELHRDHTIQAARVPGPRPVGGRDGIFQTQNPNKSEPKPNRRPNLPASLTHSNLAGGGKSFCFVPGSRLPNFNVR